MRFSFFLLFFISFAAAPLLSQNAHDIVRWDAETLNLGTIKKGQKVSSKFQFTNISQQEVEIDIVSTCECTDAKWTYGKIPPGEKGTISFVFDSSTKEHEEQIDVDVYFLNMNPEDNKPYTTFLSYTYSFEK